MKRTIDQIQRDAYTAGRECAAVNRDQGIRIGDQYSVATLDEAANNAADFELADLEPTGHTVEETRLWQERRGCYVSAWQQGYVDFFNDHPL